MIDRYLERGTLYVWEECGVRAVCVATDEGHGVLEIKNIAVDSKWQRHGYGRRMMSFLEETSRGQYRILQAGTGESPGNIRFYERCGFQYSHRIKDFFWLHYGHPITEEGVSLRDMVYFRKVLEHTTKDK